MKVRLFASIAGAAVNAGLPIMACLLVAPVVPVQAATQSATAEPAPQAEVASHSGNVQTFLATYCTECHGPRKQRGDRRFDHLSLPPADIDTLTQFQDILNQLNLGEMPPRKTRQPTADQLQAVIAELTRSVAAGGARLASTGGQTVLRRLNRREYINTISDLFRMNMAMFDPTSGFPRDETVAHQDNIGDALKTSGYLLAQYLDAADQVVEKAFTARERLRDQTWKFAGGFRQQPELRDHAAIFGFRYLCLYESAAASTQHEGAYGPLVEFAHGVPADGYYEIKVKAEAKNRKNPYDPMIFGRDPEAPFRLAIVPGNEKVGALHLPQPIEPQLAEAVLKDEELEWYTFKVWLDAGYTPRFTFPNGTVSIRNAYGRIVRTYSAMFPETVTVHLGPQERTFNLRQGGIVTARIACIEHGKLPHIRIHEVQIRGPLYDQWPPATQTAVLGDKPFEAGRTREILQSFASRAYRRPATADEVNRLMAVVERRRQDGREPLESLKDGLKATLCSPAFLYLAETGSKEPAKDRSLSAHALAARLSYFLWSTTPDAELSRLADNGELLESEVLLTQARRLLADAKSDAFVAGFLDGWLNLRSLGDMPPDRTAFASYYAQSLQSAMKRETQLFTRHLVDRNESIVNFLDADYTFLNRPLAQLYGMDNIVPAADGHIFRQVKLSDRNRGGLLGQGSVLTVSANGVETSPVTRGVWLLENILGTPPSPPPDNVPPIDPDIRGAKSIREILVKHRDNPSCFECHRKIDPLGFALENFDPIGAWRTRDEKGTPIDPSGELPGGQSFKNVAELKRILVERKEQFARMLTEKVLGYACGRRIEPRDRSEVVHIVGEVKRGDYGFRHLIEQVVLSKAFRSK
jgi:hypothetical protein